MNTNSFTENNQIKDKETLHHEALKTLCALQQYMTTLHEQSQEERQINYFLSFRLMKNIVDILYKTLGKQEYSKYPTELLIIENKLEKIIEIIN
jgi:hypothetical protein